jgi:hypothetical protein
MHGFLKPTSAVGWSIIREAGGRYTDSKHGKQHKGVEGAKGQGSAHGINTHTRNWKPSI